MFVYKIIKLSEIHKQSYETFDLVWFYGAKRH